MTPHGVTRLSQFGETIFSQVSRQAQQQGAVNLGQGAPDESGPESLLRCAQDQIAAGNNQYAPGRGMPELRQAIPHARARDHGQNYDPDTEVLVTVGATEAIAATVLGLVEAGDEVIVPEPSYDAYTAAIALAGAEKVAMPLIPDDPENPEHGCLLDIPGIEAAITSKTAMIILNTPHNPTGSVFGHQQLAQLAGLACEHDLVVLTDEVYEHLVFDDQEYVSPASLPGMRERTIIASSAAKSFNVTGWKTGWALGPENLIEAVMKAKQFLTYVGATPFQPAVAHGLREEKQWVLGLRDRLMRRRDELTDALRGAGFTVHQSAGTYFLLASYPDHTGEEAARWLIDDIGVAAIPVEAFTEKPGEFDQLVRLSFCKSDAQMREAYARINHRVPRD